jgi:oxygen-independent coproporphyrinogen-3 oxidase
MPVLPLSLYIHLPWCVQKCPYCDFNSHALKKALPEKEYLNCLLQDLEHDLETFNIDRPLHSIFIGGGTPSLFSPASFEYLLNEISKKICLPAGIEITMEANPGTVEHAAFRDYQTAGINRVSLGIQSFQNDKLKRLGRIHSSEEAQKAIETVQASFENFNLDLMFGLPNQTIEDGLYDLTTGLAFQPTHLSWYQLTLEANTIFYKNPPALPSDEIIWMLQEQGQALLKQHGYHQYEISAYSKTDSQCKHNLNYWRFGDYLGTGAGAHGKITLSPNEVIRTRKIKQPQSYMTTDHCLAEKKNPHNQGATF